MVTALTALGGLALTSVLSAPVAQAGKPRDAVQQGLDRLVRDDGFPAALAAVQGRPGPHHLTVRLDQRCSGSLDSVGKSGGEVPDMCD